ncbi:MAG TPA: pseudouridine synthase [Segetibacter sp.]|jgi:23S rRNA pseudouridine2457 synthase
MHRYFIIYKPFQALSQFTSEEGKKTLADYFNVPKDVYPVGRLDYDSEGLLILTNDSSLNHRLLNPRHKHEREYWVQVEGNITGEALNKLQQGVTISIDGKQHKTLPAKATKFEAEPVVFERNPPIRFRKEIPTSWLSLILHEGKNRQVRKMTATVNFPTLRLIRFRIEKITLEALAPGSMKELSEIEIYKLLFN